MALCCLKGKPRGGQMLWCSSRGVAAGAMWLFCAWQGWVTPMRLSRRSLDNGMQRVAVLASGHCSYQQEQEERRSQIVNLQNVRWKKIAENGLKQNSNCQPLNVRKKNTVVQLFLWRWRLKCKESGGWGQTKTGTIGILILWGAELGTQTRNTNIQCTSQCPLEGCSEWSWNTLVFNMTTIQMSSEVWDQSSVMFLENIKIIY